MPGARQTCLAPRAWIGLRTFSQTRPTARSTSFTNNDKRKADQVDKANPRAENLFGHIIELAPNGGDHADESFTWDILVRCGNPRDPRGGVDALWNPDTSDNGWFACPDNACVDNEGRLWIATDQGDNWARTGRADGLYGLET